MLVTPDLEVFDINHQNLDMMVGKIMEACKSHGQMVGRIEAPSLFIDRLSL